MTICECDWLEVGVVDGCYTFFHMGCVCVCWVTDHFREDTIIHCLFKRLFIPRTMDIVELTRTCVYVSTSVLVSHDVLGLL